ncbi:flagellar protein FliS [Clostridium thermobutyricum]|uniref:Flagellar protein FliS n=1 Tax=Clostridium thermobutyricum TaxID=29372 RepID=N9XRG7_9CLOT|nr:flagellar export chaperone FliS [Clostridium thermobutyricum]ENZ02278.1 flagellar protein FliS [Clostridium thermobutyricum]
MYNNAYNVYKNNSITYASKDQLLLMIVDGAVKFSKIAREALKEGNVRKAHENLIKAQDIFSELMISLDTNSEEWAKNIFNIYAFIKESLVKANLKKDIEELEKVIPLIEEVRDLWYEVEKKSKK